MTDHPRAARSEPRRKSSTTPTAPCSHLLEQAFNGSPQLLAVATGTMYALKAQAQSLMQMPDGDETTAGPTFEYVAPDSRS